MNIINLIKNTVYNFYIQVLWIGMPKRRKNKPCNTDMVHFSKDVYCSLLPIYENRKGVLTIISDDGDYKTSKYLKKLSKEFDVSFTVGGIVKEIVKHIVWWEKLTKNGKIEVVNHSYNHIRMEEGLLISKKRLRLWHEISNSNRFFNKYFNKQICFVCPENQMCINGYKLLKKNGIIAVRRGERGLNDYPPKLGYSSGSLYNLKTIGIMDDISAQREDTRRKWIDNAINEHKWVIEMWHNISKKYDCGYQTILLDEARLHLQYINDQIQENNLWMETFTNVVKYIKEYENISLFSWLEGDAICIYPFIDYYLWTRYELNYPVSIRIFIPQYYSIVDCSKVLEDNSIIVNCYPNQIKRINIRENE